jgi:hypothetical protein
MWSTPRLLNSTNWVSFVLLHFYILYDFATCLPFAFDFGVSPIWSPIRNPLVIVYS